MYKLDDRVPYDYSISVNRVIKQRLTSSSFALHVLIELFLLYLQKKTGTTLAKLLGIETIKWHI